MIRREMHAASMGGAAARRGARALLALAALTCAPPPAGARPPAPPAELAQVCKRSPCQVTGALPLPDRGGEIVLENLDARASVTPYLHRAGWPDLRSNRAILASILTPGMRPEATALALWELVRTWRYSCTPWSEKSQELHDPVKLVNVFGCGLCDDTNAALATLARQAGLPARLWGLGGHVVAEVSYDGGWHMLDAADGVYFRDDEGAIAALETLARRPELVASTANRALRRPAVERMAQLLAHGAGAETTGERAAVQAHFARLFRGFLASRGETGPAAAAADPAELDRIVFARYAGIVQSTADNAVSDWWSTAGSDHTMALALRPGDRLVYTLRPVGEADMACYLGADACFDASGELRRAALDALVQPVSQGRQPVVVELLPYAVTAFSLDGSALAPGEELDVFLGLDDQGWSSLGVLARTAPLEYSFPEQAEPRFGYSLKLLRRGAEGEAALAGVRLATRFRVAGKTLAWPAPGQAPVIVEATVDSRAPEFSGLRVVFRRTAAN